MRINVRTICLIAIFTALMCAIAPISIPMVPVPITLATLMVYVISALFPITIAPVIIALYILLGALGMPIFSNFSSGVGVLFGPTGGYIFGYIFGSLLQCFLISRFKGKKWMFPVSMAAATFVIYLIGSAWFMIYMGGRYNLGQTLMACVVPFLFGDSLKIVLASFIGLRLRNFFDTRLQTSR